MYSDPVQRLLLALILVALVVLVVQGFTAPSSPEATRYRVSFIKSRDPWIMRYDNLTGQVEQFKLRGARRWVVLGGEAGAAAAPAPAPAAADVPEPAAAAAPPPAPPEAGPSLPEVAGDTEVAALRDALGPANPVEIRIWAAELLGSYAAATPDTSVPVLLGALDDDDPRVVAAAARSLGASGSPDALPAVEALMEHPDPDVQKAAVEAVARLE